MSVFPEPESRAGRVLSRALVRRRKRSGLTLVEMVISISILSVGLVGTLQVVRVVGGASADPMIRQQVGAIADAYLTEVLMKDFHDPNLGAAGGVCPTPEASRSLYDNVCDYDGTDDVGARDALDSAIPSLASYRVRVDVDTGDSLGGLSGPADLLRVDVRVTYSTNTDLTVSGYRSRR